MKIALGNANPGDWYNMVRSIITSRNGGKWIQADLLLHLMPDHIAAYQWRARALVNMDPDTKLDWPSRYGKYLLQKPPRILLNIPKN